MHKCRFFWSGVARFFFRLGANNRNGRPKQKLRTLKKIAVIGCFSFCLAKQFKICYIQKIFSLLQALKLLWARIAQSV
jgi:hypothetical protein